MTSVVVSSLIQRYTYAAVSLALSLAFSACGLDLGGEGEQRYAHPVIERFTISGSDEPKIVTTATTLRLEVEVTARSTVEEVRLYANDALLHTFSSPPLRRDWQVTSADNGFYSFRVEATDGTGNMVVAHYRDRLGINIP